LVAVCGSPFVNSNSDRADLYRVAHRRRGFIDLLAVDERSVCAFWLANDPAVGREVRYVHNLDRARSGQRRYGNSSLGDERTRRASSGKCVPAAVGPVHRQNRESPRLVTVLNCLQDRRMPTFMVSPGAGGLHPLGLRNVSSRFGEVRQVMKGMKMAMIRNSLVFKSNRSASVQLMNRCAAQLVADMPYWFSWCVLAVRVLLAVDRRNLGQPTLARGVVRKLARRRSIKDLIRPTAASEKVEVKVKWRASQSVSRGSDLQ